ncbi:hypothetical protein DPMN_067082 [Dreissena polymorpha]|uniref:Uncharacterized protein n=1 Tax=Dreissena polymorpha TaxID=45954 RepID=A0A9D4BL31_DREPO|nr:hypothetical protein DPMN_067082 [Dreissena polymorpha]
MRKCLQCIESRLYRLKKVCPRGPPFQNSRHKKPQSPGCFDCKPMITTGAIARTTLRETGSKTPKICYTTINNRPIACLSRNITFLVALHLAAR